MKITGGVFLGLAWLTLGAAAEPSPPSETGSKRAAEVIAVHPSGESVPESLLRVSIRFARPPVTPILPRIVLRREDGTTIEQPFLDQELWSPDARCLSILLHPARVKSGLEAHEALGYALQSNTSIDLIVDGTRVKTWKVTPAESGRALDPAKWKIVAPAAATRDNLRVVFDAPIDALDADYLAVVDRGGHKIEGELTLSPGEMEWSLRPTRDWEAGDYRLLIHPRLEDPEGNTVGVAFGSHASEPVNPDSGKVATLGFSVQP